MTKKPSCCFQALKNAVVAEWKLMKVRIWLWREDRRIQRDVFSGAEKQTKEGGLV